MLLVRKSGIFKIELEYPNISNQRVNPYESPNPRTDHIPSQSLRQDFCLWIDQAVKLLSENSLAELDREHLIEEISDMGIESNRANKRNIAIH